MGHLSEWEVTGASKCIIVFWLGVGGASGVLHHLQTTCFVNIPLHSLVTMRSDFCSDSDLRLRGVSPQTCGHGHSEGCKQILTLSIVKLFPIAYRYYNTNF